MREEGATESAGGGSGQEERSEERDREGGRGPGGRRSFSDGLRHVNAVLSAFKEAVEESFQDARDRGDLSTERARELVQGALSRARGAAGEAKERFDFVGQRDFDELADQVEDLRARLERVEKQVSRNGRGGPGES
jgi:polyhydroxyalkanoate synthesis regulator phasin